MKDPLSTPLATRLVNYKHWVHNLNAYSESQATFLRYFGPRINLDKMTERRFTFGNGSKDYQWVEDPQDYMNFEGTAHMVHPTIDETGWYVNDMQETTVGVVYELPARRGWVAGCTDPWNCDKAGHGPAIIDVSSIYEDKYDAACAANRLAERYAESCREEDAKYQAAQQIESEQGRAAEIRDEIVNLIEGIKRSTLDSRICDRMKADIRGLLREKTKCYARIAKLQDNYWEAVS